MKPRATLALAAAAAAVVLSSPALQAYLKLGTQVGNSVVSIEWQQMPINYRITNRDAAGVSASQLQGAVARSFEEWADADLVDQLSRTFRTLFCRRSDERTRPCRRTSTGWLVDSTESGWATSVVSELSGRVPINRSRSRRRAEFRPRRLRGG